jgi:modified peptide precursor CbpA
LSPCGRATTADRREAGQTELPVGALGRQPPGQRNISESDGKGFRRAIVRSSGSFFVGFFRKGASMVKQSKKPVIAYRKKCQAQGTGLSHYIFIAKKAN